MKLQDLTGTATTGALRDLTATGLQPEPHTVTLTIQDQTIHTDTRTPANGTIHLGHLADIIETIARDTKTVVPQVTIRLVSNAATITRTIRAILSPGEDIPATLTSGTLHLLPPGATIDITLPTDADPKITFTPTPATQADTERALAADSAEAQPTNAAPAITHTRHTSGGATIHTIQAPDTPGVITIEADGATHTAIVRPMPGAHTITFRNIHNAPQTIHTHASITTKTTRKAQSARIRSRNTEYDIRTDTQFEINIRTDSRAKHQQLHALTYATDIRIDGHDVILTDCEHTHDPATTDAYEHKLTVTLARPLIQFSADGDTAARIFQSPFTRHYK